MSFVSELKRRKVFQVAAVYLVVAWLIMQVVDVVNEPLRLPEWFATVAILIVAIGFPIALILSWAFDLTPEGVVRDTGSTVAVQSGGRRIEYVLIGLLVVAVGWLFYRDISPSGELATASSTAVAEAVEQEPMRDVLPNSVAVLPFVNLSPDPNDEYFAAGVHEQIISELAKIRDLSVIARTTVMQYEDDAPPIPEIAAALRVETVLEGSVRYAGENIRVTAQLIDGASGIHLWTEEYDGSRADIFGIQSDIAIKIAMALEAELSPAEQQSIAREPTNSPEAYEYYLRARTLVPNIGTTSVPEAFHQSLDRAIELDPEFALAYAVKSADYAFAMRRPQLDVYGQSTLAEREAMALGFAEKALSIDPNLGFGYMALGLLHRFSRRGVESVEAFEKAYQLSPNNFDILDDYGRILSLMGHHEEAIRIARRTEELRPGWVSVPETLSRAGEYAAASEAYREIARIGWWGPRVHIFIAYQELHLGNFDEVRAQLALAEELMPDEVNVNWVYLYGRIGDSQDASRLFSELKLPSSDPGIDSAGRALGYLGIGDERQALELLNWLAANLTPYNSTNTEFEIARNSYADPILDQPEFVEVRRRLGFRE